MNVNTEIISDEKEKIQGNFFLYFIFVIFMVQITH